jgi:hypothetical protein
MQHGPRPKWFPVGVNAIAIFAFSACVIPGILKGPPDAVGSLQIGALAILLLTLVNVLLRLSR